MSVFSRPHRRERKREEGKGEGKRPAKGNSVLEDRPKVSTPKTFSRDLLDPFAGLSHRPLQVEGLDGLRGVWSEKRNERRGARGREEKRRRVEELTSHRV